MVDTHLQNRHLILLAQSENSERQTKLIVEIAGRFQYPVSFREYTGDHLLRAGLSDAAGDPDHLYSKLLPVKLCDRHQRL